MYPTDDCGTGEPTFGEGVAMTVVVGILCLAAFAVLAWGLSLCGRHPEPRLP